MAATKDLRHFLKRLEEHHPEEIIQIEGERDPRWELSALVHKLASVKRYPVIFCQRMKGSKFPLVCNLHADRKKMAIALETTEENLVGEYLQRIRNPIPPIPVSDGPVKEVVMTGKDMDLMKLPIVTHCEKDAGPYVTAGVGILKDPDNGVLNVGMYRHMLHSPDQLGVFLNPIFHGGDYYRRAEKKGAPLEIAIVIGSHPALAIGSQNTEPMHTDDYALIGGLMRQPLRTVSGEFVSFPIPADAEIVLEGFIPPYVRKEEGPLGEYPYYYGRKRESPIVEIKAISHRRDAIYHDLTNAHQEHLCLWLVPGREAGLYSRIKEVFPTVKAVHMPFNGSGYHAYVSIEKVRDGDGKNVILATLGSEPILKHVVVVDEDVNIFNDDEVLWAISTRFQGHQDLCLVPGARTSPLDPSSYGLTEPYSGEGLVTKVGLDATKPLGIRFPEKTGVPKEMMEKIRLEEFLESGLKHRVTRKE